MSNEIKGTLPTERLGSPVEFGCVSFVLLTRHALSFSLKSADSIRCIFIAFGRCL